MSSRPLCVDLDNTLFRGDLFFESAYKLVKSNIFYLLIIPYWALAYGKAKVKFLVAKKVNIDFSKLPLNREVFEFINQKRADGQELILVTGSSERYAEQFCDTYNIFSGCFGSSETYNMVGEGKARFLIEKFGSRAFDYIGDSKVDLFVWKYAKESYLVSTHHRSFERNIENLSKTFKVNGSSIYQWLRLLRVYQWVKNSLVFTPIIFSHSFTNVLAWSNAFFAFVSFSLVASSVYLLNDILDLDSDRANVHKKKRPLAAGNISLISAGILLPIILGLGLWLGLYFNINLFYLLLGYFIANIFYSIKGKELPLIDVILITSFYTVRIIAGGVVTGIMISFWFRVFSFFIFLSLGFLKRFIELNSTTNGNLIPGRGYKSSDLILIEILGLGSGLISILVFVLYLFASKEGRQYGNLVNMWPVAVALLYWIGIMWFRAARGEIIDDPVKYAIRDKISWAVAIFITLSFAISF